MKKIVFLGDSITDVGRNNTNGSLSSIGQGYPLIVSAKLGAEYAPMNLTILASVEAASLTCMRELRQMRGTKRLM